MNARPLILAAASLAALPAPAHAAGPTLQEALRIADAAAGPDAPCHGQTIAVDFAFPLAAGIDGGATGIHVNPDDTWTLERCAIALSPRLNVRGRETARCDATVHEVLHLRGDRHADTGIMQPSGGQWPACHRLTRKQRADELVSALLPTGRDWRVTCTPGVKICWARAAGARTRRYTIGAGVSTAEQIIR